MKERIEAQKRFVTGKVNEFEVRVIEVEYMFDRREEDDHQVDMLTSYTMRIHCGLILTGGFVEDEELNQCIDSL